MPSQQLIDHFDQFRAECIWLRICYNMHSALFNESTEQVLTGTAPTFFTDISRVLGEYIVQRICVLTDPEKTGKNQNLSTNAITAGLKSEGLLTQRIEALNEAMDRYRGIVLAARNKLISHLDRDAVLAATNLGAHTEAEMHAFYEDLQNYCDEVGRAVGLGPLDFRSTACKGDTHDLIKVLKSA